MCELNKHVFRQYSLVENYQKDMEKLGKGNAYTTTRDNVPKRIQHPYIETGYRPTPMSFYDCAKSAFYLNNEFVNFWTHFIPLIWMANRLYWLFVTLDDPYNSVYYTLYLHSIGSMYLLIVSCVAHLFSAHSVKTCSKLFEVDALGIICYGVSLQLGFEHLVCPVSCYAPISGLTSNIYAGFMITYCITKTTFLCRCNDPTYNIRHLKYMPHIFSIIIINIPCIYRFMFGFGDKTCWKMGSEYAYLYLIQAFLTVFNFSLFGLRFPEKYFKGTFDIFGQSHQIFHIGIAAQMFAQNILFELTAKDIVRDIKLGKMSRDDVDSSWVGTVVHYSTLVLSIHLILYLYHKFMLKPHVHKD